MGKEKVAFLTGFKPLAVVEAYPCSEGGWVLMIEFIEREAIPSTMDLIGLYEVTLNDAGQVLSYARKALRKRGEKY